MMDEVLDRAENGPTWLRQPAIAKIMQDALLNIYAHLYKLWAYVVMPNHVHVLLRPKPVTPPTESLPDEMVSLRDITKRLKGYAAREANKVLGLTGNLSGKLNPLIIGLGMKTSSIASSHILKIIP